MPRKKAVAKQEIEQDTLIDVAPEPQVQTAPEPLPVREPSADGTDRVSVKLIDGAFDVNGLRKATAEKFQSAMKKAIGDPEFRKWAGLEGTPIAVLEEAFSPEQFGILLDVVVKFEVIFMSGKTGLTSEETSEILSWSQGEHAIIDKQGARIIARYVPAEWLSKVDLWLFIISFLSITAAKMKR